jgi:hypothetical protein
MSLDVECTSPLVYRAGSRSWEWRVVVAIRKCMYEHDLALFEFDRARGCSRIRRKTVLALLEGDEVMSVPRLRRIFKSDSLRRKHSRCRTSLYTSCVFGFFSVLFDHSKLVGSVDCDSFAQFVLVSDILSFPSYSSLRPIALALSHWISEEDR